MPVPKIGHRRSFVSELKFGSEKPRKRPIGCAFTRIRSKLTVIDGAGSGGRTHTVLLPPDFESGASANSTIPAHNAVLYYTIAIVPFQVKFSPARCPPQPQSSVNQVGLDGIDEKAGFPVNKILQF